MLVSATSTAFIFMVGGSAFAQFASQSAANPLDPQASLALVGRMFGVFALILPLYLLFAATMTTAANRAILEPDKSAFGYLRLGADELRTLVVMLAVGLIVFVAYLAFALLFMLISGVAAIGGAAAGGDAAGGILVVLLMVLMVPTLIGGIIWFATRMSLAVPQTFDTRSINIFGNWALTKGHTGKLFLAYLLAACIYFAINLVGTLLNLALGVGRSADALNAASGAGGVSAMMAPLGPAFLISLMISGLVSAIGMAVMACPSARAYRTLGKRVDQAADVFA